MINRRSFLSTSALMTVALATGAFSLTGAAFAQETAVDPAELLKPGTLPDMTMGDPNAKVTIVEYMSMTCSHCAHFVETTLPELKTKYIDTGKVYFVLREFPLDPLAAAAFMLARQAPGGKYFDVVVYLL
jgi:protein-disulfide isomerase